MFFIRVFIIINILISCKAQENLQQITKNLNDEAIKISSSLDSSDYIKAIILLDSAIKLDSNYYLPYANKSTFLIRLKRYDEALHTFDLICNKKKNYAEGYSFQGFIYEKRGQFDSAKKEFELAYSAYSNRLLDKPNNVSDLINQAFLLFFLKNKESALEEFNKIMNEHPEHDFSVSKFNFLNFNKNTFINDF